MINNPLPQKILYVSIDLCSVGFLSSSLATAGNIYPSFQPKVKQGATASVALWTSALPQAA